ncbi:hypothetical protein ACNJYA_11010 [Bradyrhizobium sp. DASA03068]
MTDIADEPAPLRAVRKRVANRSSANHPPKRRIISASCRAKLHFSSAIEI